MAAWSRARGACGMAVLFRLLGTAAEPARDVGSRLELFVDGALIDNLRGAQLVLHHPVAREVVLTHDRAWEEGGSDYHTVFADGSLYRMYYTAYRLTAAGGRIAVGRTYAAYAESRDGIRWVKPELGLIEFEGSKRNNLLWEGQGFSPFKDPNPECPPESKYKAIIEEPKTKGVHALGSPDGIHWSRLDEKPVITRGAFDSQNLAFWDPERRQYRAYVRDFRDGIRDVRTATSSDFVHWTDPEWIEYPGAPREHLYTNQVIPYYRAPHVFLGFPARYLERPWSDSMRALPDLEHRLLRSRTNPRFGTALTEGLFMSSRDGRNFQRWGEAFIRPGVERRDNWVYGDGYQNWGLVETETGDLGSPRELSIYSLENSWKPTCRLRRFTLRIDGFVSVQAPFAGGEVVTRALRFAGASLVLNLSTSAAGSVRVELQDEAGHPQPGFALSDCEEIFGDSLRRRVRWKAGADVRSLAGKPVRLRFALKDADLYSFKFEPDPATLATRHDVWQKAVDASVVEVEDVPGLPRVLLIGDSISMYYTIPTRELLAGKANVHRVPTNGGNTEKGLEQLSSWLGTGRWDVIHFNWGLHDLVVKGGRNVVPVADYERNLRELVGRLGRTGATLIWATTTPVPARIKEGPERHDRDALAYNAAALRVMREHAIRVDDLYEFARTRLREIQLEEDVHFSFEGSRVLAGRVSAAILEALTSRRALRR
jgi:lysophospholipase L1-like esterase